jgi:basic membrane protein A
MHKFKAFLSTIAVLLVCLTVLAACGGGSSNDESDLTLQNVRLAFIHVGNTADRGYTSRQHEGTVAMMANLGITDSQVLNFWDIPPGASVTTSIEEAIEWGAHMIFATSFGHGDMMLEAAERFPEVQFFHATGNRAAAANLPNFHNYFGNMSQARYLSGIAAGLRTETNKLGFVAAWPNPEVITGFTAFYLGALSVNPNVEMYVSYLNNWNNPTLEGQLAQALIDRGADVLGQHADSPTTQTVAQANGVWSVGYNNDMSDEAPDAFLVAPMFDWSVYLTYAVRTFVEGGNVRTDVLYGLNEGMVLLSAFNPRTIVAGTAERIAEAEALLRGGRNIFTGPIYGADGTLILADGAQHIEPISAPSWNHIIQGIIVLD